MRLIHTVNSLHTRHGGPSRSVTALCDALAARDQEIRLLVCRDGVPGDYVTPTDARVKVTIHGKSLPATLLSRRRHIKEAAKDGNAIVHDHGLWLPSNIATSLATATSRVPYIVSTRGMLEPWALQQGGRKKRLAWLAYQRYMLRKADVLHATAASEAEGIRALQLQNPIAVIPNGVHLPQTVRAPGEGASRKRALFLSRIHPKKGLPMLLEAWKEVRPRGWELLIAGPEELGHRAELEKQARQLGLVDTVSFMGAVDDEKKWELYGSADLFVLPTHSENFGIVVAEAMAARLPVITTKGAPWAVLERNECGWWTDISVDAIAAALREATSMSSESLGKMGGRGAAYVQNNLSWEAIGEQMAGVYEWVLHGGPSPSTIFRA